MGLIYSKKQLYQDHSRGQHALFEYATVYWAAAFYCPRCDSSSLQGCSQHL